MYGGGPGVGGGVLSGKEQALAYRLGQHTAGLGGPHTGFAVGSQGEGVVAPVGQAGLAGGQLGATQRLPQGFQGISQGLCLGQRQKLTGLVAGSQGRENLAFTPCPRVLLHHSSGLAPGT